MKFSLTCQALLKPLQTIAGAVERKQTKPILGNVLFRLTPTGLTLVATDTEVEMVAVVTEVKIDQPGEITAPARKLIDICRSLPEGAELSFNLSPKTQKLNIKAGTSRFSLATLAADKFPEVKSGPGELAFVIQSTHMLQLIDSTAFSMAQQDVRYFLNGLLFELKKNVVIVVATDGHRLAYGQLKSSRESSPYQVILPRKGVTECQRLLSGADAPVTITLTPHHARFQLNHYTLTSKLIDGRFPDYERVIPREPAQVITLNRAELQAALTRVSILSNEKCRGVRMLVKPGEICLTANNPEQEEAEEVMPVHYQGNELDIGFNVSYLLDILQAIEDETVQVGVTDNHSSALIQGATQPGSCYVLMPMRI